MSEELKYKIYSTTECIPEQTMFDYIDNKLTAKEQHRVEKHLLDCDLCSDALEGLELLKNRNRIASLNQKINERVVSIPKKESKIVFFNFKTITSLAAAVALLIGGVFLFNQFAVQKMKENDVAELKKESSPPPPVTMTNTEPAAASDSILLKQPESITTVTNEVQFEALEKSQQQFAQAEEQKPDSYYKNPIANGEGVTTGSSIITNGDVISKTDKNSEISAPIESNIPKAGLLEKEKDLAFDETKKAEEKNENANVNFLTQQTAPAQKNAVDNFDTDKKTSKNNRSQSDTKGKDKAAKQVATDDVSGNVGYTQQNVISDQENLKSETETKNETTIIVDPIIIFRSGEPQFPGGNDSLVAFIKRNFNVSKNILNWNSAMGTKIIVEFTIDINGTIQNPKITQGINQELNDKAIEMVKKMPEWIPVSKPFKYVLPINIEFK